MTDDPDNNSKKLSLPGGKGTLSLKAPLGAGAARKPKRQNPVGMPSSAVLPTPSAKRGFVPCSMHSKIRKKPQQPLIRQIS